MKSHETQDLSQFVRSEQKPPELIDPVAPKKKQALTIPRSPLLQDPDSSKRLGKSLLVGAALQAATMFGMQEAGLRAAKRQEEQQIEHQEQTERAEGHRKVYEQSQQRSERLDRSIERLERVQRERRDLVIRSRIELRDGRFDLGEFLLSTNRLDALEDENRALDTERARAELSRLQTRFTERMEQLGGEYDTDTILQALQYAVAEYNYHGIDGLTLTDALNERVAECRMESDLLPSILWKAGIRSVGIRVYAPGAGQRFGHRSPILLVQDGHRQKEVDLISGGAPFRDRHGRTQGAFLHASDLVEAYARYNHIPPPESPQSAGPQRVQGSEQATVQPTAPVSRPAVGSGQRGEHFAFPVPPPTESEAFPDLSPAYDQGIMHLYGSRRGRIQQREMRTEQSPRTVLAEYAALAQSFLNRRYTAASEGALVVADRFDEDSWMFREIAQGVDTVDILIQQESSPSRRLLLTGTSASLWGCMHLAWVEKYKPRSAEYALRMAETRRREFQELLPNIRIQDFIQAIELDRVTGRGTDGDAFQSSVGLLNLQHTAGWPLLYEVAKFSLEHRTLFQNRTQMPAAFVARLLESARSPEEYAQVWELIKGISLYSRAIFYQEMEISDPIPEDGPTPLQRELNLTHRVHDDRTVIESVTGMVRSSRDSTVNPRLYVLETPIVASNPPRWTTFDGLKRWNEEAVQGAGIDPRWSDLNTLRMLDSLRRVAQQCSPESNSTELERIQSVLLESLPWLRASRQAFLTMGMSERQVNEYTQRIGVTANRQW